MATEFMRQNINSYKNVHIDYETKKILESKSGIILMTAHFGNWELIPSTLSRFKKIAIVVKIQKILEVISSFRIKEKLMVLN